MRPGPTYEGLTDRDRGASRGCLLPGLILGPRIGRVASTRNVVASNVRDRRYESMLVQSGRAIKRRAQHVANHRRSVQDEI